MYVGFSGTRTARCYPGTCLHSFPLLIIPILGPGVLDCDRLLTRITAALANAAVMLLILGLFFFQHLPTYIIEIILAIAQYLLISFVDTVNSLLPLPPFTPPTSFRVPLSFLLP